MAHKHKAVSSKHTFAGWVHCVTPAECAANPQRQRAHGSITNWDRCKCGAVRLSEENMGKVNYGPWQEKEAD